MLCATKGDFSSAAMLIVLALPILGFAPKSSSFALRPRPSTSALVAMGGSEIVVNKAPAPKEVAMMSQWPTWVRARSC